jgi:hypothetical protein
LFVTVAIEHAQKLMDTGHQGLVARFKEQVFVAENQTLWEQGVLQLLPPTEVCA